MAESPGNSQPGSVASIVALSKDIFALLRDFSLFVVAVLLIVFPSTFNAVLTNAGFEEGSFAGLKWKRQFYDTDTALRTAQDTITSLQTRNADLLTALAESKTSTSDAKQTELISSIGASANESIWDAVRGASRRMAAPRKDWLSLLANSASPHNAAMRPNGPFPEGLP